MEEGTQPTPNSELRAEIPAPGPWRRRLRWRRWTPIKRTKEEEELGRETDGWTEGGREMATIRRHPPPTTLLLWCSPPPHSVPEYGRDRVHLEKRGIRQSFAFLGFLSICKDNFYFSFFQHYTWLCMKATRIFPYLQYILGDTISLPEKGHTDCPPTSGEEEEPTSLEWTRRNFRLVPEKTGLTCRTVLFRCPVSVDGFPGKKGGADGLSALKAFRY